MATTRGGFVTMKDHYTIRVLAIQEGSWWVGQCLEYDIAAQAKSLPDLYYELERTVIGHLLVAEQRGFRALEDLPPAPQHFWKLWDQSKMTVSRDPVPFRVPPAVGDRVPTPEFRIGQLA